MSAPHQTDFDRVVKETEQALAAFVQGDASRMLALFSRSDDVVLANPLGPPVTGPAAVDEGGARAATLLREGSIEIEKIARHATSDLGYVFHIERVTAKVGDIEEHRRFALRVTMIYRLEDVGWRIVHRQADPIMTPRPIESIFEE